MIGLGLSIALMISSVVSAQQGEPVLVAAQLIASAIFYCGSMMAMSLSQISKIKDILETHNRMDTLNFVKDLPADKKEPTMNELRELWGLDRVE